MAQLTAPPIDWGAAEEPQAQSVLSVSIMDGGAPSIYTRAVLTPTTLLITATEESVAVGYSTS